MKKRNLFGLLFAIILSIGLIGCGSDETSNDDKTESDSSNEETDVDIGMLKLTSSAPLFIAIEKGFFEEENINLNVEWFDAAQPIELSTIDGLVVVVANGITASIFISVYCVDNLLFCLM